MRTMLIALVFLFSVTTVAQDSRPTSPQTIDLRPWLDASGIGPRPQGHRPTCSVFAVTSALEAAVARIDGRGVRLSVEYLNWAGNAATGRDDDGDFFHYILAGFEKYGAAVDADWTYGKSFAADAKPSDEVIARGRANQARWKDRLTLRWIKKIGPPGLDESQYRELMTALSTGHVVAVGSAHSRVIVGAIDDATAPGGRRFPTLDSGSGRYEELTAEWVKSTVNDAFYFMVDDRSSSYDPREVQEFERSRPTDLRPRFLGKGWKPHAEPGESSALLRALSLCAEMVAEPAISIDAAVMIAAIEAEKTAAKSSDDRQHSAAAIEKVLQKRLKEDRKALPEAERGNGPLRVVLTEFEASSKTPEAVHAAVIKNLLKTDPVVIEKQNGDAVVIVGHCRSAAGSLDGIYRTLDVKSGRFVDLAMHEVAADAVAAWSLVPRRVQRKTLVEVEVPVSRP